MARLIVPNDFTSQILLLGNIVSENTSQGADSPLTAFLTQQGIALADDTTAGENAQTHETSRALLSKQSENYRQLRDNYFTAPWSHVTGCAQFLKSFYKGNTKELGNWGFTVTDSGKMKYPAAFIERVEIFAALVEKNSSYDAGASPLQPYLTQQAFDFEKDGGLSDQALSNNNSFTAAAQQSENETELRNQLWLPVVAHIKTIGNFLMKLYSNNPKALGAWGFVVDNSGRKPKERTTKLKLGEQIILNAVLIGSTLNNIGLGELHLYKGKTTLGTPIIIHAGEQFGIMKGYSIITIVNPSTVAEAKFTVVTSK